MDLRSALVCASSPDPEVRASGDQMLQSCEGHPGFYSSLWNLIDKESDLKLKTLGLIYFKNGIDKYWRKNSRNGITEAEKDILKPMILQFFGAHDAKVLNNSHALIVAKIARYDYPMFWPQLIDQLLDVIRSSFSRGGLAFQIHGLYTLHVVIKTLASKTLATSRAQFMAIAPPIFEFLMNLFNEFLSSFFTAIASSNENGASSSLEISLLALKSCRRLLVYGYNDLSQNVSPLQFYQSLVRCNQEMLKIRSHSDQFSAKIDKFIILIGKIYLDLQDRDLIQFILTPGLLDVVSFYWKILQDFTPGADDAFDKVILQALTLMRRLVKNSDFNIVSEDENVKARANHAQTFLSRNIFTPDFTRSFLQLLVIRYVCLSSEDLQFWNDEPEQFVQEEEADHWEYNVRLCSEKLVVDLVSQYRDILAPTIISMVDSVTNNTTSIGIKESTYCILGLCAKDLADFIDFNSIFASFMVKESMDKSLQFKIIRRQIALAIKNWIPVKVSRQMLPVVYETLLQLSNDSDGVVKLTSIICLRHCIDDFDFELENFMPFVSTTIGHCLSLLNEFEEFESKLCILNTISVLVLRLEDKCSSFAPQILNALSIQWQNSDGQHLFKSSIVSIVTSLILALQSDSYALSVAIPIVRSALNANDASHIYILEEGLDLCLAIVQNAKVMTQELYELTPLILNLLDYGTESLKAVLKILAGMVILAPENIFQDYGQVLTTKLSTLLGSLVPEASKHILNLVDTCIQVSNPPSIIILQELNSSGLLKNLIMETIKGEELHLVLIDYNCILSRIILNSPEAFLGAFNGIENADQMLSSFVDQLVSRFDSLSKSNQRVLVSAALAQLLHHVVISRIQFEGIMIIFSSVLLENSFSTTIKWDSDSLESIFFPTQRDFINFIATRLQYFANRIGQSDFQNLLKGIDPTIQESLQKGYL